MTQSPADTRILESKCIVKEQGGAIAPSGYGVYEFWTGQPTITKAVFWVIDLSISPAEEALEMMGHEMVIGPSEELKLHRMIYILGGKSVHNVQCRVI